MEDSDAEAMCPRCGVGQLRKLPDATQGLVSSRSASSPAPESKPRTFATIKNNYIEGRGAGVDFGGAFDGSAGIRVFGDGIDANVHNNMFKDVSTAIHSRGDTTGSFTQNDHEVPRAARSARKPKPKHNRKR
jgi:hypothetical protein